MARNGSGTYALATGNPVVTGTSISSTWANNTLNDLASAVTQSISNDGQTPITANLPMTGFKHTNVANATARTEYCAAGQAQDNTFDWLTLVAGTDTITATAAIGLASYAAGQCFRFVSAGANTTTTVTLNLNSLGAKAVTKNGSTALAVGDIPSGCVVEVVYDGTRFQLVGVAVNYAVTATTATNIAGGASGSVPYQTASGTTTLLAKGTNGQVMTLAAGVPSWATLAALTSGTTQPSTSGSSIDFISIPSWVKRITVNFSGVSTTGTAFPAVQIGTGGVLETTNYVGCTQRGTSFTPYSSGFAIDNAAGAAYSISGSMTLSLLDSATNTWACSGVFGLSGITFTSNAGGHKALAGVLDKVSVVTTDAFDAGLINILYE
ncbi:MAG TPA: hypothetical protein VIY48_09460 [Candidatus Paceibacterota bacterium]